MNAHYLQHVPFEGLGSIRSWLEEAGYHISSTLFFQSQELPSPEAVDVLVVMGGPMSVHDERIHPWLAAEKRFIRAMIDSGKPVLGICLGAQLIACAMGAGVYPNPVKEIGWFPIEGCRPPERGIFHFPPSVDVFHWHGDTFDLPEGAYHLAQSRACKNQAFQIGRSVIGLQFHLEMTPPGIVELVRHCRNELVPSSFVQPEREILSTDPEKCRQTNQLMDRVLTFLLQAP
jgi:GMP synthase-like glutamine amidotransferase